MRPAAQARVDAMDLSDRWVEAGCDLADPLLQQEREKLVASYTALRAAVYRATVLMPGASSARVNSTNSVSSSMWALCPGRT